MLEVIGAGVSRTGTYSFKLAMEALGFSRCHHMVEVIDHPDQAPVFLDAANRKAVDWRALYDGYAACCDFPSCFFWRELLAEFPGAKVVLTIRDPESWYRSMSETILPSMKQTIASIDSPMVKMGEEIIQNRFFAGNLDDRAHVIEAYRRHNQAVRDTVPADRLLEFDARQGWEPLCTFLGVAVPETSYPKTNSLEEYMEKVARVNQMAGD